MSDLKELPTVNDLRAYLRLNGWAEQSPGPVGAVWSRAEARLGVPHEPDTTLISGVVQRIAAAERRPPEVVANEVRHVLFDVTNLQASGFYGETDAIPLETGARILVGARAMFRATATTARRERSQIGQSYSKIGDDLVREVLMGHTRHGSYIIPVLMPLPEPETADLHQQTLDYHMGPELHRAPPEPFARRVVRTFAQSMQAVRELVVEPARVPLADGIHELVYRGVSREFCSALVSVLKQRAIEAFEASVTWAPAIRAPETMPHRVAIEAAAVDLVAKTAEKLRRQRVDSSSVFSGTIVQLRHESHDDPYGEIAVSTVRRGRPSEVHVRLRMEEYLKAWEWHSRGQAVLVEGSVRRTPGRPLRVDNPIRCYPLDDVALFRVP
jgi:hypothetical protein